VLSRLPCAKSANPTNHGLFAGVKAPNKLVTDLRNAVLVQLGGNNVPVEVIEELSHTSLKEPV